MTKTSSENENSTSHRREKSALIIEWLKRKKNDLQESEGREKLSTLQGICELITNV